MVSAALVALAGAGFAVAGQGPRTFDGDLKKGGVVSFRLSGHDGKAVDDISIDGIAADCRPGSATLDYVIFGDTPVNDDRTFAVRSEDGTGGKALVKGRFSRKFRRVEGVVRVYGKFFGDSTRCDTGKQKFKAG